MEMLRVGVHVADRRPAIVIRVAVPLYPGRGRMTVAAADKRADRVAGRLLPEVVGPLAGRPSG
jgi:hypothetical protein